MIGYLTGKIISKKPTELILDVNGVGYLVKISITTFDKLPEEGESTSLYTFLSVKEDSLDIYGFFHRSEKEMFELLISVNGIGPKSAQTILSGIQLEELKEALQIGDVTRIIAVPGIGRKTAERMMLELKDKADLVSEPADEAKQTQYKIKSDAVVALANLGYNQRNAQKIVRGILDSQPGISIEDLIKEALAVFNK